jgi:hypothetical protein
VTDEGKGEGEKGKRKGGVGREGSREGVKVKIKCIYVRVR